MANEAVAPAAAPSPKSVGSSPRPGVQLPEAFQPRSEAPSPEPTLDAFAELEQIDAKNPAGHSRPPKKGVETPKSTPEGKSTGSKSDKTPEPAGKTQKPAQDKGQSGEEGKPAGDGKTPPSDEKPLSEDDPSRKFQLASELRKDYRRLHSENQRLNEELKQARSGKREPSEDQKALSGRMEALEKRNKELEEEISYRDYTKSSEFAEKYKKPFESKLAQVYRNIQDLSVTTEDGTERAATQADFDKVLEAPNSHARELARKLFGDDFREVLQYRRELNELQQNADNEMKNWREKAQERAATKAAEQRKFREMSEATFKKSIDNYTQKYPEWFGEVENDAELNEALHKGFEATDRAQDPSLPLEERIDLLAATRLKAASFGRLVMQIKRLQAKVAEQEESLKSYEQSTPGEGRGQRAASVGAGAGDDEMSANDEIDALERRNPVPR